MNFNDKLEKIIKTNNSLLCVGLDTDISKNPVFEFNKQIIDETHDLVCSYKPNIAFYSAQGMDGINALVKTIEYIHSNYPDIPVILDAKRGDVGSTSKHYAKEAFDIYKADAVTVNPYLGFDSVKPFLEYHGDKGIIFLCRTSNPGASDFQDLKTDSSNVYLEVAKKINEWNRNYGNCLMVVGATWPEQLKEIRNTVGNMFILVPGIGTQGGSVKDTLKNGLTEDKSGLIISASRSIIFASKDKNFAREARKESLRLREEINKYR